MKRSKKGSPSIKHLTLSYAPWSAEDNATKHGHKSAAGLKQKPLLMNCSNLVLDRSASKGVSQRKKSSIQHAWLGCG